MRKRITYANVAATLALVFSMTGGALAAKHYLINSTTQINPKVLKKLTGKKGATGSAGAQGAPGATGKEGTPGKEGKEGKEGKAGSVPASLVSGTSESGDWAVANGESGGGFMDTSIAFPEPLAAALASTNVEFLTGKGTDTNCPGEGKAAAGFLCVYVAEESHMKAPAAPINLSTGFGGADKWGFFIFLNATAASAYAYGSWTVTA